MNFEKRFKRMKLEARLSQGPWPGVAINRTTGKTTDDSTPSQVRRLVKRGIAVLKQRWKDHNGHTIEIYHRRPDKGNG